MTILSRSLPWRKLYAKNTFLRSMSTRESMAFDVLIVGGGPAGLAASIRLKQLCQEKNTDLSVCLIDKGSEIGSHILSGNVLDPKALHNLLPDKKDTWRDELLAATGSYATPVKTDEFRILPNMNSSFTIPNFLLPSQLHNDGNYIISLSQMTRWLASIAEEMNVEIYPGFAASEILYNNADKSAVTGIATRDVGIAKDGTFKDTYEPGVNLLAKQTIFAEGARGSFSEQLMEQFNLRANCQPQTYGLGIKEVWQIPQDQHIPGFVQHTLGYPLQSSLFDKTFGGSFLYHQEPDLVLIGMVVGLDYENPYLNPYQEFQRWKLHPDVRKHLENGTCISYGARVLNEGGYHSIPQSHVPGAVLAGCSAGFLNAVKIKGTHTAMQSGILAAEAIFESISQDGTAAVAETGEFDPESYAFQNLESYGKAIQDSWITKELFEVRNAHAAFAKYGVGGGLIHSGLSAHLTKGNEPWTLTGHVGADATTTKPASGFSPISYPPADNKLTFDLLTNLQRSGTYHAEDQPCHLRIKENVAVEPSLKVYGGPEQRFSGIPSDHINGLQKEQCRLAILNRVETLVRLFGRRLAFNAIGIGDYETFDTLENVVEAAKDYGVKAEFCLPSMISAS